MLTTPIGRLRLAGLIEGLSFLALLGIAMPLKYLGGMPMAVKIAGWIHGVLFIVFAVVLVQAWRHRGWAIDKAAGVLIAALIPFGPFVIDGRLKREDEEAATD